MLQYCLRAVLIGAVLTFTVAAPALAQEGRLIGGETLTCVEYEECNPTDGPCTNSADFCSENVCTSAATMDTPCCLVSEGCDRTGGACMPVTTDWGHCVDGPPPPTTCPDHPLSACFQRTSWDDGNCDGDRILNHDELPGCICDPDETCGDVAPADGGGVDGGTVTQDAGQSDARLDAGRDKPPPAADDWDYRGSGGCTCDASSAGADAEWLLCGLAVVIVARRRRRVRAAVRSRGRRRS